jgi:hypothetical protein
MRPHIYVQKSYVSSASAGLKKIEDPEYVTRTKPQSPNNNNTCIKENSTARFSLHTPTHTPPLETKTARAFVPCLRPSLKTKTDTVLHLRPLHLRPLHFRPASQQNHITHFMEQQSSYKPPPPPTRLKHHTTSTRLRLRPSGPKPTFTR